MCIIRTRTSLPLLYIYKWRPRYPLHTHTDTCNNILSYIIYYLYNTPKHGVFTAVKTRLCPYAFFTFAINVFLLILFFNNIFIFKVYFSLVTRYTNQVDWSIFFLYQYTRTYRVFCLAIYNKNLILTLFAHVLCFFLCL